MGQRERISISLHLHRWNILSLSAVISVLVFLIFSNQTPQYESAATLLIKNPERDASATGARNFYATQLQILESRQLAGRVVKKTHARFAQHPDFNPALDGSWFAGRFSSGGDRERTLDQQMIDSLLSRLVVSSVADTNLVNIRFRSRNPATAAEVANLIASEYIVSEYEAAQRQQVNRASRVSDELAQFREQLTVSEKALADYQAANNLSANDLAELDTVVREVSNAKRVRMEASANYNRVQSLYQSDPVRLTDLPEILAQPAIVTALSARNLADARVAQLADRYGSRHTRMITAISEQKIQAAELARQLDVAVTIISGAYETAVSQERELRAEAEEIRGRVRSGSVDESILRDLERKVESDRQFYVTFFNQLNQEKPAGSVPSSAVVIDDARLPTAPDTPDSFVAFAIAMVASLVLTSGLAVGRDILDDTIKMPADVSAMGVALLGVVPGEPAVDDPSDDDSGLAFRAVTTRLMLASPETSRSVAIFTPKAGEGGSTVAKQLAHAIATSQPPRRVLHVDTGDGDMTPGPGLADFVAGARVLDACCDTDAARTFASMHLGTRPALADQLFSSPRFAPAIADLCVHFDFVVIDGGPVCGADSLAVAAASGTSLLVVQADEFSRDAIVRVIDEMQPAAQFLGVVLDQSDAAAT